MASEEELTEVENHINEKYAKAMKEWECPWLNSANSDQSEDELMQQYYQRYVNIVSQYPTPLTS
jgi:hypothetical protein